MGVTIDDARAIVAPLSRSYEALVRDRVKFRVGQIVYAAFSRDETIMGFAFPKEEREALVASEPDKFLMPGPSDMRYRWVCVRLEALGLCDAAARHDARAAGRACDRDGGDSDGAAVAAAGAAGGGSG